MTLVAGCTNAPLATSTAAPPTPVAAASANTPSAPITVAAAPDLTEYVGRTCSAIMGKGRGAQRNIDDYVTVGDRIFVRHRHGPTNVAEDQLHGADALRPVVKGWSGWPYEFDSDSGAREFPKPGSNPQNLLMKIDYYGVGEGTYDCQPASAATVAATAQLASKVAK